MNRFPKAAVAALALSAAFAATSAGAVTISNPTNSYSFPYLSGALIGGQQTQYVGQTFTAPVTGELTNFQFTVNGGGLQSVYGVVFEWDGNNPGAEIWRSGLVSGLAGLKDFNPTGVTLQANTMYVAFLSTYETVGNSGLATIGTCLTFGGCDSNNIPNLGTLVYGNVFGDDVVFTKAINNAFDATFSVTIEPAAVVPEPATWAMMIGGIGLAGGALRRRKTALRFA